MINLADISRDDVITIEDELGNRAEGKVLIDYGRTTMMAIHAFGTKINVGRLRGDSWVRASSSIKVVAHQAALDFR
jgi:hypothetical protein